LFYIKSATFSGIRDINQVISYEILSEDFVAIFFMNQINQIMVLFAIAELNGFPKKIESNHIIKVFKWVLFIS